MMNTNKYLPIGTVVLLENGKKRVMVTGYKSTTVNEADPEKKETEWDYNGCIFPEGIIASDQMLVFNHSQIKEIFFMGLTDLETQIFHEKLNNL